MELFNDYLESPLGIIEIIADNKYLFSAKFKESYIENTNPNVVTEKVIIQLKEYFNKSRQEFTIPMQPSGTEFRLKVWNILSGIGFGQLKTYKEVAIELGSLLSIRAVGTANGANPIPIIIPCHRVIGSDNNLVGYSGGLWRKKWLLEHENAGLKGTLFDLTINS